MLDASVVALTTLFDPLHLLALAAGVVIGMVIGAVPAIGGMVGLAILLPFTFEMEPTLGIMMMIGLIAIVHTTDTIPSVLFGIPGTAAAQATILDGYQMAKKGQAELALGAAFVSSIVGGLVGALVLGVSIPILRPVVLAFGSPEMFMAAMMGLTMVGVLSTGSVLRGLICTVFGMMLAMVGPAPQDTFPRWTFGSLYLSDGIPLIPVAMGMFAVPEMIELYVTGGKIAKFESQEIGGPIARIRRVTAAALKHWFLILRSSLLGTWVGILPGLGGAVVDWIAYGHAVATEKGARDTFGTGDIRGVIAPESANNAKVGGELIPTLILGIPGSGVMAIFLAALYKHNIIPGREMLTSQMNLVLMIVWGVAIAGTIGGLLCLLFLRPISRVTFLPSHYIIPMVFVIGLFSTYQTSRDFGDMWALFFFSVLGWIMKSNGWPRPPFILGFVLSELIEYYVFLSFGRFGWTWISRPIVIVLFLIIVGSIAYGLYLGRKKPAGHEVEI